MPLLKEFRYHSPKTVAEAVRLLKKSRAPLLLAGGTFVLNYLKKAPRYPADVIGLKKIEALQGIKDTKQGVVLGAMTTIAELLGSSLVCKHFPSLSEACSKLATTPVRNMATLGGNICSRFFWVDLPAVLVSLSAEVQIVVSGKKKAMALEDFLCLKDPKKVLLTGVLLPRKGLLGLYWRHTKTLEVDAPSLGLAFSCRQDNRKLKNVKLVVNTALSFPVELKETARVFEGRESGTIDLAEVRERLSKDAQKTKLDAYRIHCLEDDLEQLVVSLKRS